MSKVNKAFLAMGFALAMGCGEQSVGDSAATSVESTASKTEAAPVQLAQADTSTMSAMAPVRYVEGTHYQRLTTPVPTVDRNKIEIAEVFWYGCSHCYVFESKIVPWKKSRKDDVIVVKSPAIWDNRSYKVNDPARYTTPMANHARIYYTAKSLNALETITPAAFLALSKDHRGLRTQDEIADLFVDNGVAREDFERTFNSFGVTNAVRQAEARQGSYQVQGTPEVIVNGTYRVSAGMAGSQDGMLKVAEFLIDKIRKEK